MTCLLIVQPAFAVPVAPASAPLFPPASAPETPLKPQSVSHGLDCSGGLWRAAVPWLRQQGQRCSHGFLHVSKFGESGTLWGQGNGRECSAASSGGGVLCSFWTPMRSLLWGVWGCR